ncbi:uncharacterized protein BYT42DRAFT_479218, partial [Radiomyces spectabilis]|uniref:uncharacterized protein n=1 Tax=Radiomyces spectabilis TaxID=64574 RepID=UPI00221E51FD
SQEDVLILLECTSAYLESDMIEFPNASLTTFKRRQVLAIQAIDNKITLLESKFDGKVFTCVEIRSALVPTDWAGRFQWIRVFELLIKLKKMCLEQNHVTETLLKE